MELLHSFERWVLGRDAADSLRVSLRDRFLERLARAPDEYRPLTQMAERYRRENRKAAQPLLA